MAKNTETANDTSVPSNDAYTGMLAIALIALIVGSILLFLDYRQYAGSTPTVEKLPPVQKVGPPEGAKKDGEAPAPVPPGNPMPDAK
jgi:hypothetical protein